GRAAPPFIEHQTIVAAGNLILHAIVVEAQLRPAMTDRRTAPQDEIMSGDMGLAPTTPHRDAVTGGGRTDKDGTSIEARRVVARVPVVHRRQHRRHVEGDGGPEIPFPRTAPAGQAIPTRHDVDPALTGT